MLKLKPGVSLTALQPQMTVALIAAEKLYDEYGVDLVVTSGNDSQHSETSLHYSGNAIDLRTRTLPDPERDGPEIGRQLKAALGQDYDVLFEGDHLHVEHQPKRR